MFAVFPGTRGSHVVVSTAGGRAQQYLFEKRGAGFVRPLPHFLLSRCQPRATATTRQAVARHRPCRSPTSAVQGMRVQFYQDGTLWNLMPAPGTSLAGRGLFCTFALESKAGCTASNRMLLVPHADTIIQWFRGSDKTIYQVNKLTRQIFRAHAKHLKLPPVFYLTNSCANKLTVSRANRLFL